jgi:SulP family sulfate permease
MMHSLFLLLFILVAAPLASYVPLAALAGLLATVAWNMAERHEFAAILARSRGEAAVLLATFLLTIFRDLTEAIAVGVVLGSLVFMHRMAGLAAVEVGVPLVSEDEADEADRRPTYDAGESANPDVMVLRLAGPLFFGASSTIAMALERIGRFPRTVILDLSSVPLADASAAASLKSFVQLASRHGARTYAAGATPHVRHVLVREGLKPPLVRYAASVPHARAAAPQA